MKDYRLKFYEIYIRGERISMYSNPYINLGVVCPFVRPIAQCNLKAK